MVKKQSYPIGNSNNMISQKFTSSIDDIFARPSSSSSMKRILNPLSNGSISKGKSKQSEMSGDQSSLLGQPKQRQRKKKNLGTINPIGNPSRPDLPKMSMNSAVETILDPSIPKPRSSPYTTSLTTSHSMNDAQTSKRDRKELEEDEIFRDSRGTGSRMFLS